MSAVTGTPASSGSGTQNSVTQTNFQPQDAASMQNQWQNLHDTTQGYQRLGNMTANQSEDSKVNLGTGFQGSQLKTEFQGPQFSQGLNATSQNLIASELGNRQAAQARQQQNIGRQFGGSGVGRVLAAQSAAQGQLSNNPLALQAYQQQFGQEAQTYGLGQQAQQNTNQARMDQTNSGNNALNMGNQAQLQQQQGNLGALNQAFNQRQGLIGNQQNLMQQLQSLAQARGQQVTNTATTTNQNATASPLVEHLKAGGTAGKLADSQGMGPQAAGSNPGRTASGPIAWAGTPSGSNPVTSRP